MSLADPCCQVSSVFSPFGRWEGIERYSNRIRDDTYLYISYNNVNIVVIITRISYIT